MRYLAPETSHGGYDENHEGHQAGERPPTLVGTLELALEVSDELLVIRRVLTAQRLPLKAEVSKTGGEIKEIRTYDTTCVKGKVLRELRHVVISERLREIHHGIR